MILAGPCLLNDKEIEIENIYETARQLKAIDSKIILRTKLEGGGTTAAKWISGIGFSNGLKVLRDIKTELGIDYAIEIRDCYQYERIYSNKNRPAYIWISGRTNHNYTLINELYEDNIILKRSPMLSVNEILDLYDLYASRCEEVILCERGIISFDKSTRYKADLQGLALIKHLRPDIPLMIDPSHATFNKDLILPVCKMAKAIGIDGYMLEVYADPTATQSDKDHALSIDEFKKIHEVIK